MSDQNQFLNPETHMYDSCLQEFTAELIRVKPGDPIGPRLGRPKRPVLDEEQSGELPSGPDAENRKHENP